MVKIVNKDATVDEYDYPRPPTEARFADGGKCSKCKKCDCKCEALEPTYLTGNKYGAYDRQIVKVKAAVAPVKGFFDTLVLAIPYRLRGDAIGCGPASVSAP